jgi:signal transduction histidine kinase/CheY-like chemotaxis protein
MWSDPNVIDLEPVRISTNRAVVARMRWGGLFYALFSSATVLMSPTLSSQSSAYLFVVLFLILAAARLAIYRYAFNSQAQSEAFIEQAVLIAYLATAASWVAFLIWIFKSIQTIDSGAALSILTTAGIMAGGIAATSPRIRLMLAFAILLYIPSLVSFTLFLPVDSGWVVLVIGLSYFVFSVHNGKLQHENYWIARQQAILLEKQAVDLEQAKVQAESANKAKSAFLATVSHEIRTPMNGVLGITEILATTPLNAEQQNYVGVIRHSGQTLLRIIDDILDYAKIDAHKLKIVDRTFDLNAIMHEIDLLFRIKSKNSAVNFIADLDCGLSRNLIGDPDRIKQILFNLLGNAFKFTERGEIRLLIRCLPVTNRDGIELELTVKDTGIGISTENQTRLFQEFIQIGESAQHIRGTGLGLAITHNLVALMHGTITVSSEVGKGSEFRVCIPLKYGMATEAPQPGNVQEQCAMNPDHRAHILVVDDNEVNQLVTEAMLDRLNCKVILAVNGLEAVAAYTGQTFDMVLMDCNMPVMDGFEATRRIRALERENRTGHTPIVALTAHALDHIKQECLDAGMDDHLSKPVNFDQLDKLLQQYIPAKSTQ